MCSLFCTHQPPEEQEFSNNSYRVEQVSPLNENYSPSHIIMQLNSASPLGTKYPHYNYQVFHLLEIHVNRKLGYLQQSPVAFIESIKTSFPTPPLKVFCSLTSRDVSFDIQRFLPSETKPCIYIIDRWRNLSVQLMQHSDQPGNWNCHLRRKL